jgi:hypothetical protein
MLQVEAGTRALLTRVLNKTQIHPESGREMGSAVSRPGSSSQFWRVPGIVGSTRVLTNFGHVPAHLVRVRDMLRTRDGGFLPVLRIGVYRLDEDFLERHPDAAPVVIRKRSLCPQTPKQDVILSPAQMVGTGGGQICDGVIPATELSRQRGGINSTIGMLAYFQFHLPRRVQINCEGVWVSAEAD